MDDVLEIKNLNVSFDTYAGVIHAVRGVCLTVRKGEVMALVGESGCGKSVTAQSVLALNPPATTHLSAECLKLAGENVLGASEKEMEAIRGRLAGMVFQDPLTCLNPTMKVGLQITEALYRRKEMTRKQCEREAVRLLAQVQISDAEQRAQQYPHQFSGGMRQRAMIAMALACKPKLIIADEPTTALDVTTQFKILLLLKEIRKETQTAVLLITHDLGVVANMADRVAVMYAGKIVEAAAVQDVFSRPAHPYTQGLLSSLPTPGFRGELSSIPGTPPDLYAPPAGCAFAQRCAYAMRICVQRQPDEFEAGKGHIASCWRLHPDFVERG